MDTPRRHPVYIAAQLVLRAIFRLIYRARITGLEHVPRRGGVLLVANHQSHFDPPFVGCWLTRGCRFVARESLFRGPFGRLIAFLGAIPVRRGEPDTAAIRRYVAELHAGQALLMFPEGTRGGDGPTGGFLRGAALLIKRANVDVIPVGIDGPARALPRGRGPAIPPPRLSIAYGEPIPHADLAALPPDQALARLADEVERLRCAAQRPTRSRPAHAPHQSPL